MGLMEMGDGSRKRQEESESDHQDEAEYLHRHCDSTAVFWQDGVAHCITCGQAYPLYEPVSLYLSQEFSVSTYFSTPEQRQIVMLIPGRRTDQEISVEEAEAIGKALQSVPRIKTGK